MFLPSNSRSARAGLQKGQGGLGDREQGSGARVGNVMQNKHATLPTSFRTTAAAEFQNSERSFQDHEFPLARVDGRCGGDGTAECNALWPRAGSSESGDAIRLLEELERDHVVGLTEVYLGTAWVRGRTGGDQACRLRKVADVPQRVVGSERCKHADVYIEHECPLVIKAPSLLRDSFTSWEMPASSGKIPNFAAVLH